MLILKGEKKSSCTTWLNKQQIPNVERAYLTGNTFYVIVLERNVSELS